MEILMNYLNVICQYCELGTEKVCSAPLCWFVDTYFSDSYLTTWTKETQTYQTIYVNYMIGGRERENVLM